MLQDILPADSQVTANGIGGRQDFAYEYMQIAPIFHRITTVNHTSRPNGPDCWPVGSRTFEYLKSTGFSDHYCMFGSQSDFRALKNLFTGTVIDDGEATIFVHKVDNNIKRTQKLFKHRIPLSFPWQLEKLLVSYAVRRINIRKYHP